LVNAPAQATLPELGVDFANVPDRAAVFLLWAEHGAPYLAKTGFLRRRLRRLLAHPDRLSRVLRLGGVIERLEYWLVGSQLEAALVHLELAQRHFPEDWRKITRLRPPAFLRLAITNPFPRTMITSRLGQGVFVGPFSNRAVAERYQVATLDLFQIRRCEENLDPSPNHPGCIYGEMSKCLRPCQAVVSRDEYAHEAARFEEFVKTAGHSLMDPLEAARDRASAGMQFEEAESLHNRVERIREATALAGDLARPIDQLAGVAVVGSAALEAVELMFFIGGRWQLPRRLKLAESVDAGQSLDRRLREMMADVKCDGAPNLEHLAILSRWHGSSWRDGEWVSFESLDKIPYRRIVNAIARVAGPKS
jgi:excinuclease UvrABC nuclease subunit